MRRTTSVVVLLVCGALPLTGLTSVAASASPATSTGEVAAPSDPTVDSDGTRADDPLDPRTLALDALEQVEEILDDATDGSADPSDTPTGSDTHGDRTELSLALRDLALRASSLPRSERRQAAALLARPTDKLSTCTSHLYSDLVCYQKPGTPSGEQPTQYRTCSAAVCVHWVNGREATRAGGYAAGDVPDPDNAVPVEDDGPGGRYAGTAGNAIPDYVETVLASTTHVAQSYAGAGYRTVRSDEGRGGNDLPDVYLGQIGDLGLYGYCTTDDPDVVENPRALRTHPSTWAYCVLDNDYAENVFATHTPVENMQVTAAHEFFHAVQYAYDFAEDVWILEATATWAEDFVYDDINDNVNFLRHGPMFLPQRPLDTFSGAFHYGTWLFFRYLTERFPNSSGGLPVIIRQLWEAMAHSGPGADGRYSLQAVRDVLGDRGTTLGDEFVDFTAANLRPRATYDDAAAARYPTPKPWKRAKLTRTSPRRTTTFRLDHLSGRTLRYVPGARGSARLRVKVAATPPARGGAVVITVKKRGGGAEVIRLPLKANGVKMKRVPFSRGKVRRVDITVVNTDSRYLCNRNSDRTATCQGRARGDNKLQRVRVALIR